LNNAEVHIKDMTGGLSMRNFGRNQKSQSTKTPKKQQDEAPVKISPASRENKQPRPGKH
jgi:hypothetical protein